jgi:phosphatidylethanolamine/phosphatidyl-N-methylethanolamine N-methyltransferase
MIDPARQRAKEMQARLTEEIRALRDKLAEAGADGETGWRRRQLRLLEELRLRAGRAEIEMRPSATTRQKLRKLQLRVVDEVRFLRNWAGNPLKTGAVAPSGQELSRLMARYVEAERPGVIVELGPGTGAVTQALIERGVAPERLVLIEYSTDFCALLRARFPGATIVQGNAYQLGDVMASIGNPPIASVVSGLPLFTRPLPERQALLADAMRLMAPGAPFIQFSYALVPPVQRAVGTTVSTTRWVLANLPPARVWLYRATVDAAAAAA